MDSWIVILLAVYSVLFDLGLFCWVSCFGFGLLVWGFVFFFLSFLRFSNFVLVVLLHLHGCLPFVSGCVIRDGRNCKSSFDAPFFPVPLCNALPLPQKSFSCGWESDMPAFLSRINQCEEGSLSFLFLLFKGEFPTWHIVCFERMRENKDHKRQYTLFHVCCYLMGYYLEITGNKGPFRVQVFLKL